MTATFWTSPPVRSARRILVTSGKFHYALLEARAARTAEGFARSLSELYLALAPRDPFALDSESFP